MSSSTSGASCWAVIKSAGREPQQDLGRPDRRSYLRHCFEFGIRFLTPFSAVETLLASFIITVSGFCGGAVMSAVKRDFGGQGFR